MSQESLKLMPVERWVDVQEAFLSDWPRCLPGYNVLESQTLWKKEGFDYGIQVYCPFGDAKNGFVAVNKKASAYELIIQYPKDDTHVLQEALRKTKVINWERQIIVAFTAYHVISAIQKVIEEKNVLMDLLPSYTFFIEKDSSLFEDVSLPPGFTFELLSSGDVELIDSKWPHRYPTSTWYFELLIDTKSGYGLYKNGELISWIFISECGFFTHLYTLKNHRKQGHAELIVKLISNELLKKKRQVFAFCVKTNEKAYKLYQKLGFKESNDVAWCYINDTAS